MVIDILKVIGATILGSFIAIVAYFARSLLWDLDFFEDLKKNVIAWAIIGAIIGLFIGIYQFFFK
jgi:hypothetical protein